MSPDQLVGLRIEALKKVLKSSFLEFLEDLHHVIQRGGFAAVVAQPETEHEAI